MGNLKETFDVKGIQVATIILEMLLFIALTLSDQETPNRSSLKKMITTRSPGGMQTMILPVRSGKQRQPLEEGAQRRQEEAVGEGGKRVGVRFLAEVGLVIESGSGVLWRQDGSMSWEGQCEGEVVEQGERTPRKDVVGVAVGEAGEQVEAHGIPPVFLAVV